MNSHDGVQKIFIDTHGRQTNDRRIFFLGKKNKNPPGSEPLGNLEASVLNPVSSCQSLDCGVGSWSTLVYSWTDASEEVLGGQSESFGLQMQRDYGANTRRVHGSSIDYDEAGRQRAVERNRSGSRALRED